jgi:hypothetical protein
MNDLEFGVFEQLFREAVKKCFGHKLAEPLSETESKLFYNKIFEETGLVIGWKSLKNYSIYIIDKTKPENPSVPTLDTLARYVGQAPYTDEVSRKEKESHYPHWFEYKNQLISSHSEEISKIPVKRRPFSSILIAIAVIGLALVLFWVSKKQSTGTDFESVFNKPFEITGNNWIVKDIDTSYWNKRNQTPGYLSLFTLRGDNWPDTLQEGPVIKNLIYHSITNDCFTAEVQIKDFVPGARWQQAGLLLMEDSSLTSKCIRLSLGYNDNFGGFMRSPEIIIQAITSSGKQSGKPEEFIHQFLFSADSIAANPVILQNFNYSTLQIEKKGNQFRFLYAGGSSANGALHEISTKQVDMRPKYIGIFALKGFVEDKTVQPVLFKSVSVKWIDCP